MANKYYWNNQKGAYGPHKFGDEITELVVGTAKDKGGKKCNDPRLEGWVKSGTISTSKPDQKNPAMGEVEALKAQIKTLAEKSGETELLENKIKTLENKLEKAGERYENLKQEILTLPDGAGAKQALNKLKDSLGE